MYHLGTDCLICTVLFSVAPEATPVPAREPEAAPQPALTIRLYNLAPVGSYRLRCARRVATRIFQNAGLEVRWIDAPATSLEAWREDLSVSFAPPAALPDEIPVRIVARLPGRLYPGALGIARTAARSGVPITVFYDRIEDIARQHGICPAVLLGHAIAHEVGHLLLGSAGHASRGLMRPRWDCADFVRPYPLFFSSEERERLHSALTRRPDVESLSGRRP